MRSYPVSSERSDYSPVVRLHITVDTTPHSVAVSVDSGFVLTPGTAVRRRPVMADLKLQALLVEQSDGLSDSLGKPWAQVSASPVQYVTDSLWLGVPHRLPRLSFDLPLPSRPQNTDRWLVFRATGTAVTTQASLADGRAVPTRAAGVRVFACSDRSLSGVREPTRAKQLASRYTAVC